MKHPVALVLPLILLGGCVSTIASVVTAPIKVAAKTADWATTSRDEADRNRGRKIRRAEEKARKECRREVQDDYERDRCVRARLQDEGV